MGLTKITESVVQRFSKWLNVNSTTGAVTSVVPDLIGSNTTLYPSFACRAWVNFDGTRDSTGASNTNNTNRFIRGSGNVSSVLRNGTGDYTITFTTAMPDANYTPTISAMRSDSRTDAGATVYGGTYSTYVTNSFLRVTTFYFSNGSAFDPIGVFVGIFR